MITNAANITTAKKLATTLSVGSLNELVRALADRGSEYGWDVYHLGTTIDPAEAVKLEALDDGFADWAEAFAVALNAYRLSTGEEWRY